MFHACAFYQWSHKLPWVLEVVHAVLNYDQVNIIRDLQYKVLNGEGLLHVREAEFRQEEYSLMTT